MKHTFGKRFIALCLALVMLCGLMPVMAFAAEGSGETTVVIAGSDYQAPDNKDTTSASQVSAILSQIYADYPSADGFLFAGDYNCALPTPNVQNSLNSLKSTVENVYGSDMHEVYVQGNHDQVTQGTNGLSDTGAHDPDSGKYGVYVIDEDDYVWGGGTQAKTQQTADNLQTYLNGKVADGFTAPIFVVSHLPLHYSLRTKNDGDGKYAKYIFDVLQAGGQAGLNIIYLFGHNHSHGWDNYLGGACIYLPEGDSINIANEGSQSSYQAYNLAFTYMNAGYVGYYTDYGANENKTPKSGVDDTLTMSVFEITDNSVTVSRYSASGVHNLKARGVQNVEKDTGNTEVKDLTVYASPRTEQLDLRLAPVVKTPVSISANIANNFNTFCTTGSFNISNYTFTVTYDDGTEENLPATRLTDVDLSFLESGNIGYFEVTVYYNDLSCEIPVTLLGAVSDTDVLTDSELVESAEPVENTDAIEALLPEAAEDYEWQVDAYDFTAAEGYTAGTEVILAMPVSSSRAGGYYYNEGTNELEPLDGTTLTIAGRSYFVFTATHFSTYLTAEQKTGSPASSGWITFPGGAETIYKLVNGPKANGQYVIATRNDAGSANAVSHNATGNNVANASVTVLGADTKSSVPYISSVDGKAVWTASSNTSFTLTNDGGALLYTRGFLTFGEGLYYSDSSSSNWKYENSTLSTTAGLQNKTFYLKYDKDKGWTGVNNKPTNVYFYEKTDLPASSIYVKADYLDGYTIAYSDWTNETKNTIKSAITVQRANNASGTGATAVTSFTVGWPSSVSAGGNYEVPITYTANGTTKTLGTMTIHIVSDVEIKGRTLDSHSGFVTAGCSESALTHSNVTLTVKPFGGTERDVTLPITVNMLHGSFNTTVPGTYPNLTVTYSYGGQTFTETGYTLIVNEKIPPNDYPQYPEPGSVKVDKAASGIDFLQTGVAKVELSASGVPVDNGIDVIVMVDTSSSMNDTVDGYRRIAVLRESLRTLIASFKKPNEDGAIPDIRLAIADFNGYNGAQLSQSTDYFGTDTSNPRTGTNNGKVYTGDRQYDTGAFVQITADMDTSFIDGITTSSGTNYDYAFDSAYKLGKAVQDAETEYKRDLYVIFMSDGAPFQYNQYTSNSGNANWNKWLKGTWNSYTDIEPGTLKSTAHSYFYNGAGNKHRMAEAIKGDPEKTYQVISFDVYGNTGTPDDLIWIKGLGATMYSVGFCLADDSQITVDSMEYVLKGIASSEDKALFCNSAAELVDAFDVIAHTLKYAATSASFDDTMGDDFDLQLKTVNYSAGGESKTIAPEIKVSLYDLYTANEVGTSVGGKTVTQEMVGTRKPGAPSVLETVTFNEAGTEAYSSAFGDENILKNGVICAKSFFYNTTAEAVQIDTNGDSNTDYALPAETFYWNIGTIRRQEVVLSYYVYLTGSMEGDAVEGTYPTNKSATLYYSNWLENRAKKVTVSPVLPWGGATVSYGFYLVDGNGVPVTNETTGVTGSFADAVKLTSPVVAGYINLNSAGGVDAINVIASANLPEGYSLFDSTAAYSLTVSSSGNGSWSISGTNPKNTTYVANFKAGEAATTQRTANDPSYDYANTTVWFAVKYEIKCIPDAVVIDYGLPVDIDVLANDMFGANGKLEAIGAMGTVAEGSLNSTTSAEKLPNGFISSGDLTLAHGKASMNGTKVRYTPTDMVMANEEHFVYAASYANARYHFGTVTVIPATSIYYEDSFVTFSGSWETVGTAENKTQAEDRPGAFSLGEFDANNVYGYDGAYSSYTTYSLGAAQKTTVSSGTNANPPTATFTFTGTAFDVVSMTNNKTGTIFVDVYAGSSASGTAIKNWVVDTYYGYSRTQDATNPYLKRTWTYGSDQAWHVVTEEVKQLPENAATTLPAQPDPSKTYVIYEPNYTWTPTGGDAIYQVPVLKSPTLDYGTYTVVIKPLYADMFNHAGGSSYDFYFDAVRVYDPAGKPESGVIHDAYAADGELNPGYVEIRNLLIGADTFNAAAEGAQVNGVVFIDGANANGGGSTPSVSDYQSYGPKNEVYLAANQAIAFRMTSSIRNPNVQIGAKVAGGSSAKMTVSSQRSDQDATSSKGVSLTLKTATEMYYSLSSLGVIWTEQNGKYVSSPIIISNTGSSGIVSLTNIKAPGASINSITPVTLSAFDMVMDALIPTAYAADDSGYDLQIYCTGVLADQAIEVLEDAMLSAYERQRRIRYDKPVLHSTLITPTEDLWQNPYIDIASGAWYYDFVKSATEKGLMQGSGNRFDPNGNLTRAMLVTVLYRMSGESAQAAELPFEDVDSASWYAAAAAWAFEKGIIKGISETEFAPMQDVSRQDMAAMIARYAEAYGLKLQPADGTKFTDDAAISDYAKDAVYGMKASGILSGRPSGAFDPKGTTNRAEAAKVLSLLAEIK